MIGSGVGGIELVIDGFSKKGNGGTDEQTDLPEEIKFYISVMFLGLPDDIHEEKPSFLQFKKKNALPTDRRTDGSTDGRTDPLIEMRGHI